MKRIMNTENMNTVTLVFDMEEILKIVYAESALHALNTDLEVERPLIITEDNREMLRVIMENGYMEVMASLLGYISSYELDNIGDGELKMELMVPSSDGFIATMLRHKIEVAFADYVLSQIYNTECDDDAKKLADSYSEQFRRILRGITSSLAIGR